MSEMIEFIKPDFAFTDDRGYLKQLCHEGWKQVNVSFTKSGVFRGGHYHKLNNEAFYISTEKSKFCLPRMGRARK